MQHSLMTATDKHSETVLEIVKLLVGLDIKFPEAKAILKKCDLMLTENKTGSNLISIRDAINPELLIKINA